MAPSLGTLVWASRLACSVSVVPGGSMAGACSMGSLILSSDISLSPYLSWESVRPGSHYLAELFVVNLNIRPC